MESRYGSLFFGKNDRSCFILDSIVHTVEFDKYMFLEILEYCNQIQSAWTIISFSIMTNLYLYRNKVSHTLHLIFLTKDLNANISGC